MNGRGADSFVLERGGAFMNVSQTRKAVETL
jgi:hypothetical protein